MKFWWCNQSQCWREEFEAGVVCSSADTTQPKFREMVLSARAGDITLHYRKDRGIVAVSRAKADAVACKRRDPRLCLYGDGWAFPTEYHHFSDPIPRKVFLGLLGPLAIPDGPVISQDGEYRVRRAYFMPFTRQGLENVHSASRGLGWPTWVTTLLGAGSAP